jgi:hypothetical protein
MENTPTRAEELGVEVDPGKAEFGPLTGENLVHFLERFPAAEERIKMLEASVDPFNEIFRELPESLHGEMMVPSTVTILPAEISASHKPELSWVTVDPNAEIPPGQRPGNSPYSYRVTGIVGQPIDKRLDLAIFWIHREEIMAANKRRAESLREEYGVALNHLFAGISGDWGVGRKDLDNAVISPRGFAALLKPIEDKLKGKGQVVGLHKGKDAVRRNISSVKGSYQALFATQQALGRIQALIEEIASGLKQDRTSFEKKLAGILERGWVKEIMGQTDRPSTEARLFGFYYDPVAYAVQQHEEELADQALEAEQLAARKAREERAARDYAELETQQVAQINAKTSAMVKRWLVRMAMLAVVIGIVKMINDDDPEEDPTHEAAEDSKDEFSLSYASEGQRQAMEEMINTELNAAIMDEQNMLAVRVDGSYEPLVFHLTKKLTLSLQKRFGPWIEVQALELNPKYTEGPDKACLLEAIVKVGSVLSPGNTRLFDGLGVGFRLEEIPPKPWHQYVDEEVSLAGHRAAFELNDTLTGLHRFLKDPEGANSFAGYAVSSTKLEFKDSGIQVEQLTNIEYEIGANADPDMLSFDVTASRNTDEQLYTTHLRIPVPPPTDVSSMFSGTDKLFERMNPNGIAQFEILPPLSSLASAQIDPVVLDLFEKAAKHSLAALPDDMLQDAMNGGRAEQLIDEIRHFLKHKFNDEMRKAVPGVNFRNIRIREVVITEGNSTIDCHVAFTQRSNDGTWIHSTERYSLILSDTGEPKALDLDAQDLTGFSPDAIELLTTPKGDKQMQHLIEYGLFYAEDNQLQPPSGSSSALDIYYQPIAIVRDAFNMGIGPKVSLLITENPFAKKERDEEGDLTVQVGFTFAAVDPDGKLITHRKIYPIPLSNGTKRDFTPLEQVEMDRWDYFLFESMHFVGGDFGATIKEVEKAVLAGMPPNSSDDFALLGERLKGHLEPRFGYYGISIDGIPKCRREQMSQASELSCVTNYVMPNGERRPIQGILESTKIK